MAQFVQLMALLSLCLMAAFVNAQNAPSYGNGVCTFYTNEGNLLLDLPKVIKMMEAEFRLVIQTLNPMVIQQWMTDADDDHDNLLNLAECSKMVQTISDSVRKPPQ